MVKLFAGKIWVIRTIHFSEFCFIISDMFNINTDDISESYDEFRQRIKDNKSFAVTGLTSVLRLFLLSKIKNYSKKKALQMQGFNSVYINTFRPFQVVEQQEGSAP